LEENADVASIILAAGKGTRMVGYDGNKTLLPLIPGPSPYQGSHPMLLHILSCLPPGPKALVIHHGKESIIEATVGLDLAYCFQPELNGTGGALLSARAFVRELSLSRIIITMGDVPLVRRSTYLDLVRGLEGADLMILGFQPTDKRRYGVLEIEGNRVTRIIEWEYWHRYPYEHQEAFKTCNSGIYAVRRDVLLMYLHLLEARPHRVRKERKGTISEIQEFFITDLIELMARDGLVVHYILARDEREVMGVDDLHALKEVQELYRTLDGGEA